MKDYQNMTLADLKYEWVLEMNAYDTYADKRQWKKIINEIECRINQLEKK
ncbi:hypothetical protein [Tenacibaculum sp. 190524A02b]